MATAARWRTYWVKPSDTDPMIDVANGRHVVMIGECQDHRGLLYLFLPATRARPSVDTPPLQLAARYCLHAIALSYPNKTAAASDCRDAPAEPDCFAAWRREKIDGVDRSGKIEITPANGIENRLLKLLRYLALRYPADGWDRYLQGDEITWNRVIASGLSQGGGQAAMLAKIHPVARVVMFGAVADAVGARGGAAPVWESTPGATPPDRFYGFAHQRDAFWDGIQRGWIALGLERFGPIVNVDDTRPPFGGTHRLTTDVACVNPGAANCAHTTVVAPSLAARFTPVWEYMLGLR